MEAKRKPLSKEAEEEFPDQRSSSEAEYIRWFEQLTRRDVPIAGGKGANLGELAHAGIPVPPGFVVLAGAFDEFLKETKLRDRINDRVTALDTDDTRALEGAADELADLILRAHMPTQLAEEIQDAYAGLSERFVAVRSSATAE
ncbi:MAG TPA: PEP/pyruvate-binding domain-containing protein, partial [Armatimonadota bacterium]